MADNFADFYSGGMRPPLRLPNGTLIAAPSVQPRESVDQEYRGIYPTPSDTIGRVETINPDGSQVGSGYTRTTPEGLGLRGVQTVAVDPSTGMPVSPHVQAVTDALAGADPTGDAPSWDQLDDQMSGDAYPVRTMAQIQYDDSQSRFHMGFPAYGSGNDGVVDTVNALDGSRLGLGYGNGESTSPGVAAIVRAVTPSSAWPWATGGSSDFPGTTDWSVANQGGGGILGDVRQPSDLPANPPPTAFRAPAPTVAPAQIAAVHAALMKQQQLQSPAAQAALAQGKAAYVVPSGNSSPARRGRNGSALGENALTPTRAMDGSIRNSYGDY